MPLKMNHDLKELKLEGMKNEKSCVYVSFVERTFNEFFHTTFYLFVELK